MKKFYAKILLFGEYTVLAGSSALTIPFKKFSGELNISALASDEAIQSNKALKDLYGYFVKIQKDLTVLLDLALFEREINQGLYFNSTIPLGYGLGSSGALVAAVIDRYSKHKPILNNANYLQKLCKDMGKIESFFHGTSSGIDPLSVFIGHPLKIGNLSEEIQVIDTHKLALGGFYLYDTGIKSSTDGLVGIFLNKLNDTQYNSATKEILIPAVNNAIAAFLSSDYIKLKACMKIISIFQFEHFIEAIPSHIRQSWKTGIETDEYYFKLCGSGGGGYLLLWSELTEVVIQEIFGNQLIGISEK